jgi:predicted nucleic acid-binding protein
MKYICDTNFILRYLLADNSEMFDKAKAIFKEVNAGESTIILEQAVFTEVVFVLSSFYKVPKAEIVKILSDLLAYKRVKSYGKEGVYSTKCVKEGEEIIKLGIKKEEENDTSNREK